MQEDRVVENFKKECSGIRLSPASRARILARLQPAKSPLNLSPVIFLAPALVVLILILMPLYPSNPLRDLEKQVKEVESLANSLEQINI